MNIDSQTTENTSLTEFHHVAPDKNCTGVRLEKECIENAIEIKDGGGIAAESILHEPSVDVFPKEVIHVDEINAHSTNIQEDMHKESNKINAANQLGTNDITTDYDSDGDIIEEIIVEDKYIEKLSVNLLFNDIFGTEKIPGTSSSMISIKCDKDDFVESSALSITDTNSGNQIDAAVISNTVKEISIGMPKEEENDKEKEKLLVEDCMVFKRNDPDHIDYYTVEEKKMEPLTVTLIFDNILGSEKIPDNKLSSAAVNSVECSEDEILTSESSEHVTEPVERIPKMSNTYTNSEMKDNISSTEEELLVSEIFIDDCSLKSDTTEISNVDILITEANIQNDGNSNVCELNEDQPSREEVVTDSNESCADVNYAETIETIAIDQPKIVTPVENDGEVDGELLINLIYKDNVVPKETFHENMERFIKDIKMNINKERNAVPVDGSIPSQTKQLVLESLIDTKDASEIKYVEEPNDPIIIESDQKLTNETNKGTCENCVIIEEGYISSDMEHFVGEMLMDTKDLSEVIIAGESDDGEIQNLHELSDGTLGKEEGHASPLMNMFISEVLMDTKDVSQVIQVSDSEGSVSFHLEQESDDSSNEVIPLHQQQKINDKFEDDDAYSMVKEILIEKGDFGEELVTHSIAYKEVPHQDAVDMFTSISEHDAAKIRNKTEFPDMVSEVYTEDVVDSECIISKQSEPNYIACQKLEETSLQEVQENIIFHTVLGSPSKNIIKPSVDYTENTKQHIHPVTGENSENQIPNSSCENKVFIESNEITEEGYISDDMEVISEVILPERSNNIELQMLINSTTGDEETFNVFSLKEDDIKDPLRVDTDREIIICENSDIKTSNDIPIKSDSLDNSTYIVSSEDKEKKNIGALEVVCNDASITNSYVFVEEDDVFEVVTGNAYVTAVPSSFVPKVYQAYTSSKGSVFELKVAMAKITKVICSIASTDENEVIIPVNLPVSISPKVTNLEDDKKSDIEEVANVKTGVDMPHSEAETDIESVENITEDIETDIPQVTINTEPVTTDLSDGDMIRIVSEVQRSLNVLHNASASSTDEDKENQTYNKEDESEESDNRVAKEVS